MRLIDISDRAKYKCHHCGTNLSVKYWVKIPYENNLIEVPMCNMCALFHSQAELQKDLRLEQTEQM